GGGREQIECSGSARPNPRHRPAQRRVSGYHHRCCAAGHKGLSPPHPRVFGQAELSIQPSISPAVRGRDDGPARFPGERNDPNGHKCNPSAPGKHAHCKGFTHRCPPAQVVALFVYNIRTWSPTAAEITALFLRGMVNATSTLAHTP